MLKKTDYDTEISGIKNNYTRKADFANEISNIKNNYVTSASLTSQLNDLKSQHIADEVKKVDDKVKKNSTDILGFKSRLKQKVDTLNDLEREASFSRGFYYYTEQSYFLFEAKSKSFSRTGGSIGSWT